MRLAAIWCTLAICGLAFFAAFASVARPIETTSQNIADEMPFRAIDTLLSEFTATEDDSISLEPKHVLWEGLTNGQQVGVTCKAYPSCPDCDGKGNVCMGAQGFYGGILAAGGKRDVIYKCQKANSLDYCGGSFKCVKLSRADQQRFRTAHGGGCYASCAKVAGCYVDNR
jgi:hypothetical protein